MNEYLLIKWVHVLSSTLLFGTGLGTAFYMFYANRTRDVALMAGVARLVVRADWWFTTPTVILQPLSGAYLLYLMGYPLDALWVKASIALYLLAGACWLPVVWLQMRMRDMAVAARQSGSPVPAVYWRLARWWTALGVPAFSAVVVVFWLMVNKPV